MPLNPQVDGMYEAWISVGTAFDHDDDAYISVGRFNMTSTGAMVDSAGNPKTLNISRITSLDLTEDALITIEPPGDFDTLPGTKLMGAAKTIESGYAVFNMTMGYSEILPASNQFAASTGKYILASPSQQYVNTSYTKGLWFSLDTNGTQPGLTLPSLPDTAEWTYQAWLLDVTDSSLYNMGRFIRPNDKDDNQQCQNNPPVRTWLLPGHDWIQAGCPAGLPTINNLTNFNYYVAVTLEPKFETTGLALPFYLVLFYGNVQSSGFGTPMPVNNVGTLPTARIRLSATS